MTDETDIEEEEADDGLKVEWESGRASVAVAANHLIIAPSGWEVFAQETGAVLVRIVEKTGDVEVLTELGKPWHTAGKAIRNGSVVEIK